MIREVGLANRMAAVLMALALAACSSLPKGTIEGDASTQPYLDDVRFASGRFEASIQSVTEASPEMRSFVSDVLRRKAKLFGPVKGLMHTVNDSVLFGFRYDAEVTRTAAETFATRSGNCLSLALMTATLAELMGLDVEFQSVQVPEVQLADEAGTGLLRVVGHVNLRVAERSASRVREWTTIDFLVPENTAPYRAMPIDRERVVALYFNNKAVDALVDGDLSSAYWWLRASIRADASSSIAFTSLGAIWSKLDHVPAARASYERAVGLDAANRSAAFNLAAMGAADKGRLAAREAVLPEGRSALMATRSRLVALIKSGQWGSAQALLNSPSARELQARDAAWMQALVTTGQGQRDAAVQGLKATIDRTADPADSLYLAAKLSRLADKAGPTLTTRPSQH